MEKITFKNLAGIMLIPAQANGLEGWFVFDTGAMQTSLNGNYFPKLEGENKQVALFDQSIAVNDALETKLHELVFGNIRLSDLPVIRMDMAYVENSLRTLEPDLRLLGSIGMEALDHAPILLDYAHATLTVAPDICTENAEKLPLSVEALPVVTLELAGKSHRFVLDTGANTCLLSGELADQIAVTPLADAPGIYVVPEIKVGTHEYTNINAIFTDISQVRDKVDVDGVIGSQILSPQLSFLDFPNGALYLF